MPRQNGKLPEAVSRTTLRLPKKELWLLFSWMGFSSRVGWNRAACAIGRTMAEERKRGAYGFRDMEATSMMGFGSFRIARINASTILASNCAFAHRCNSASASAEARAFLYVRSLVMVS